MMAPPFPDNLSTTLESDSADAEDSKVRPGATETLTVNGKPRKVKRDAMGCRYGRVIESESDADAPPPSCPLTAELRERALARTKRDDDLYFAMTELLRRIEMGHDVDTADLPEQLRAEFERGIADGSLAGFLQGCDTWWTMPPFAPSSAASHPAAHPSSGLPRSDYESISMLTFNGGGTAEYLWAQDVREVPRPRRARGGRRSARRRRPPRARARARACPGAPGRLFLGLACSSARPPGPRSPGRPACERGMPCSLPAACLLASCLLPGCPACCPACAGRRAR
jgi:hypothetical protein